MLGRRISSLEEGEHVDVLLIRRREAAIADIKAETTIYGRPFRECRERQEATRTTRSDAQIVWRFGTKFWRMLEIEP